MAWTAEVKSKSLINGIVFVVVDYTDGQDVVSETYRSPSPDTNWIPDTVRNKIISLEKAVDFDIPIGVVTPSLPETIDPNFLTFRARCRFLETVKIMIDLGAIQADNAKVIQLVNWIKTNVPTYFDQLAG